MPEQTILPIIPLSVLENEQAYFNSLPALSPAPLPVPEPTRSFWLSPDANPLAAEGSTGTLTGDADIVIIGSGITGVGAAYHLTKLLGESNRKTNVVIIEARDFCSGATGRNGGHLTPTAFLDFAERSIKLSPTAAVKAVALERHTVNSILDILDEHSLADTVDLVEGRHLDLIFTDAEAEIAKSDYEAARQAGVDLSKVEWLTGEEMQKTFGTSYPAVKIPGHNLWPLKLVTQLYKLASSLNANVNINLHTRTPVTAVSAGNNHRKWTVHTPRGDIATSYVLHATNAYASHLLPQFAGAIVPTRGQIVAIREYGRRVGKQRMEGWGTVIGYEYWFPRPKPPPSGSSGEEEEHSPLIILGGGREVAVPTYEIDIVDDSTVNLEVGQVLREYLPALFGAGNDGKQEWKVEQEWTGIMGYTKVGDPFVGPVLDTEGHAKKYAGQFIAAGYTGHGMPRAFACAEVAAQLIVADMNGRSQDTWSVPEWLPEHYLTWNRLSDSIR